MRLFFSACLLSLLTGFASAQATIQSAGSTIVVPAYGEVSHVNDEAHLVFTAEEQDKDRSAAESRVGQKMKRASELLRHEDATARLKTRGYSSFPIYAEESGRPSGKLRPIVGWRVLQYLDLTTSNLAALPASVAAAQSLLALQGISFQLREATRRQLEEQRIGSAYANLVERIGAISKAMGRSPADVVLENIDFDSAGVSAPESAQPRAMLRAGAAPATVSELPSFEAGESILRMRVVGRFRFR